MEWQQARQILTDAGQGPDEQINLFDAGLALGLMDVCEPGETIPLHRCHDLMTDMVRDLRTHPHAASPHLHDRILAIQHVFARIYDFCGDNSDYDNPENANLIRVMERRRGLPVALGLIALHLAEQLGWDMHGLNFPGHFMVRLSTERHRTILDPFHGLVERGPGELRLLAKTQRGQNSEMNQAWFNPVSKRAVLLRLQNNIKTRLLKSGEIEPALNILATMRLLSPNEPEFLREQAVLSLSLGKFRDSIAALEQSLGLDLPGQLRMETTALLEELKRKLN